MLVRLRDALLALFCLVPLPALELVSPSGNLRLSLPEDWVVLPEQQPQVRTAKQGAAGDNLVLYETDTEVGAELVAADMTTMLREQFQDMDPSVRVLRSTYENPQGTGFVIYTAIFSASEPLKVSVVFCADAAHLYKLVVTMRSDAAAKARLEAMLASAEL